MKAHLKNVIFFLGITALMIVLMISLDGFHVNDENIFLLFVFVILITSIETSKLYYGIMQTIIFTLSFNYFLTAPRYTFHIDDQNYYVSFVIFITITLIVNSLVLQLKKQMILSKNKENRIRTLYDITSLFLYNHIDDDIYQMLISILDKHFHFPLSIITQRKTYGHVLNIDSFDELFAYCLDKDQPIGFNQQEFSHLPLIIFPIKSKLADYGVLAVEAGNYNISQEEIDFLIVVIRELTLVLDKEYIAKKQEESKIQMEKEKFKTALLRGLSHDIKTPLTSIQSGSDFLLESYDLIDDQSKKELIQDIYQESCFMSDFVRHLLNLSMLSENKNILQYSKESIEDILFDVIGKIKKRLSHRTIEVNQQRDMILVDLDPVLINQVIVNILENAIKHTPDGTHITINYHLDGDCILIEISDTGGGIKDNQLDKIFEDFYSITKNQDHMRSTGLGLSICKAIVEAHGGKIWAFNNPRGATFAFTLPLTAPVNQSNIQSDETVMSNEHIVK